MFRFQFHLLWYRPDLSAMTNSDQNLIYNFGLPRKYSNCYEGQDINTSEANVQTANVSQESIDINCYKVQVIWATVVLSNLINECNLPFPTIPEKPSFVHYSWRIHLHCTMGLGKYHDGHILIFNFFWEVSIWWFNCVCNFYCSLQRISIKDGLAIYFRITYIKTNNTIINKQTNNDK